MNWIGMSVAIASAGSSDAARLGIAISALAVSVIALIVAIVSLCWQLIRHYRWARPVLTVEGSLGVNVNWIGQSPGKGTWLFTIEVTNTGDESTEIVDAWWELEGGRRFPELRYGGTPATTGMSVSYDTATSRGGEDIGIPRVSGRYKPKLPLRLEPYGRVTWRFDVTPNVANLVSEYQKGRPAIMWISRRAEPRSDGGHPNLRVEYGRWEPIALKPDLLRQVAEVRSPGAFVGWTEFPLPRKSDGSTGS